jgi:hypothetical protein
MFLSNVSLVQAVSEANDSSGFFINPLRYGIWSAVHDMAGGPPEHPYEDDISESKDDSGG